MFLKYIALSQLANGFQCRHTISFEFCFSHFLQRQSPAIVSQNLIPDHNSSSNGASIGSFVYGGKAPLTRVQVVASSQITIRGYKSAKVCQ
jgi:hypothetical protein